MKFKPAIILRTRKDLITALEQKGLPRSTPSLNQFEANGIIKFPRFGLKRGQNGFDRLYTDKEIEEIVIKISTYAESKPTFGNK